MIKLIRRNQRAVLTALTIVSMGLFVVNYKGSSGAQERADPVVGHIFDGKEIRQSDLARAKSEVQSVSRYLRVPSMYGYGRSDSLLERILGPAVAEQVSSKPDLFVMLLKEAEAADVQASKDEVGEIMANLAVDPQTGKNLDPESDTYEIAQQGVIDLLKISMRYREVTGAIKISKPMVDHQLATALQSLDLNLVQFEAGDFDAKVLPPTTQQVEDQFEKFKNTLPNHPNPTTNPFGFGYKLPVRTKVQYVKISSDAIAAAVIATKSNYDWEVAARKYYLNNTSEFDLQPSTTNPSTQASTMPAIPQTYDQAHERVLQAIRKPLVDALKDKVVNYLSTSLNTDYQAYLQYCTDNKGGPEPDSSLGVRYSSFTYISRLVDTVKTRFKVDITSSETDEMPIDKVAEIPGVGGTELKSFADKQEAAYFEKHDAQDPGAPAVMMKPSGPLEVTPDQKSVNAIVFARLTNVLPSEAPADTTFDRPDIERDLRLQAGYKLAQQQAAVLETAAGTSNLTAAALAMGKPVIPVVGDDAISRYTTDIKGVIPPLGDGASDFMKQAFELAAHYDPRSNPHPTQLIELAPQGRVFVAQLLAVHAGWNSESYYRNVMMVKDQLDSALDQSIQYAWFNYDDVKKRVNYLPKKQ